MTTQHFPYRLDKRWNPLFVALGVGSDDGVDISDDGDLIATYGRVNVKTTLDNVEHTLVTGPHRWYTAVGLRLSFTDDGITFGTNHHKGFEIAFVDKSPGSSDSGTTPCCGSALPTPKASPQRSGSKQRVDLQIFWVQTDPAIFFEPGTPANHPA